MPVPLLYVGEDEEFACLISQIHKTRGIVPYELYLPQASSTLRPELEDEILDFEFVL